MGGGNYFSHPLDDKSRRRYALASFMENGHVRAIDLEGAPLCIPHRTLMNWVAQLREDGADSFFRAARGIKPRVMSADVGAQCSKLLAEGNRPSEGARLVGINESTLGEALQRDVIPRLRNCVGEAHDKEAGTTKTERSREDAQAAGGIGTACTCAYERVAAAMGLAQCAAARFEPGPDVQMAGLLGGLPALCANGLLSGLGKHLKLPRGFYSTLHIVLVLGFMALHAFVARRDCVTSRPECSAKSSAWTGCPRFAPCGNRLS